MITITRNTPCVHDPAAIKDWCEECFAPTVMLKALETIASNVGLLASCASKQNDDWLLKEMCELQRIATYAIRKAKGEK